MGVSAGWESKEESNPQSGKRCHMDSVGQLAVEMAQGCSKAEWPHRGLRPLSPWQWQLPMPPRPVTGKSE